MLRMDQVHVIRHKVLVEGQSGRAVARQMGVSRNTVRKYLEMSAPVRRESRARARPVLESVTARMVAGAVEPSQHVQAACDGLPVAPGSRSTTPASPAPAYPAAV